MVSYNRVILAGNMTRDVEMKFTSTGTAIASMGLAVNQRFRRGDEWVDDTVFVDVTAFGNTAEYASKSMFKGAKALIDGRLKLDKWESQGQKRSKLTVICDRIVPLQKNRDDDGADRAAESPRGESESSHGESGPVDDIPW